VNSFRLFFYKLKHWEYWPWSVIYVPVFFAWFYHAMRNRFIFFGATANPGIENGGFLMESKKKIYDKLPPGTYPATLRFESQTDFSKMMDEVRKHGMTFPLIAKPDIGLRGLATQKADSPEQLYAYVKKAEFPFLVQEFIPYEKEAGIFYVRRPDEKEGWITGMVLKEFMFVKGDGESTIEELIEKNPRYILQMESLKKMHGDHMVGIPGKDEEVLLAPYGNHARGARFTDGTHLVTESLRQTIDSLCRQVSGFYFGRLDIRYKSLEDLEAGRNYSIIELNGAGSDPTHIYDPRHSIWFAWREIIRHIVILSEISRYNMNQGIPGMTFMDGMSMLRANKRHLKKLKRFGDK
jgi:hypothetical protein